MGFFTILKGVIVAIVGLILVLFALDLWVWVHWENWVLKGVIIVFCLIVGAALLIYGRALTRSR